MSTLPRLSVITACFNEEATIARTIRSVVEQTFTDYELIVVDGQSTDDTLNIVEEYRDDRFVISSMADKGIYNAMNRGVVRARGDFLYFLNAGDYLVHAGVLERVFNEIDRHDQHDLYYGRLLIYDRSTGRCRAKRQFGFANMVRLFRKTLPHQATFFRRRLFSSVGLFDDTLRICGDYDWFLKAVLRHKVSCGYVDQPIAVFTTGGISSRPQHYIQHKQERRDVQLRYMNRVQYALLKNKALYAVLLWVNCLFYRMIRERDVKRRGPRCASAGLPD